MSLSDPNKLRRQSYELSPDDFREFPAWEFASDEEGVEGQDEATVRPYGKRPVDGGDGLLVVRALFTIADGTRLVGYVSPPPAAGKWNLGEMQPHIVLETTQIRFWLGMFPAKIETIMGWMKTMGKTPDQVFPLSYRSDVPILGGAVEGSLAGFSVLNDGKEEVFRL